MKKDEVKLFESKSVRRVYDEDKEIWYFSIIDVVEILTDSTIPKRYWSDLKKKLSQEGFQSYDKIVQLKLKAADGKYYASDVADTETLLRLIQSIPSPKAEPFKQWLAKDARKALENKTGKSVITGDNFLPPKKTIT